MRGGGTCFLLFIWTRSWIEILGWWVWRGLGWVGWELGVMGWLLLWVFVGWGDEVAGRDMDASIPNWTLSHKRKSNGKTELAK